RLRGDASARGLQLAHILQTAERSGGDARSSARSAMFIVTHRRGGHAKLRRSGMNGTLSPTQLAAVFEQSRTNAAPMERGGPCGTRVYKQGVPNGAWPGSAIEDPYKVQINSALRRRRDAPHRER